MQILRRILHTLLGLCALAALALTIQPTLLAAIPDADIAAFGGVAQLRLFAGGAFLASLMLRYWIRPAKAPSRKSVAWGEFANAVGGTLKDERRKPDFMGWTGGPTVRWTTHGIELKLSTSRDMSENEHTQIAAQVSLKRGFQFQLAQETWLTKVFFSQQLWNVALAAVKSQERSSKGANSQGVVESSITERMSFLAAKEILIGDARFDDAFLLKSDNPALAREFFGDAGVASCLHELDKSSAKGWQLSLMGQDVSGTYQFSLSIPGIVLDPQGLDASRKLAEASIRCFADQGMLASSRSQAA